jgi:hypothetical protein
VEVDDMVAPVLVEPAPPAPEGRAVPSAEHPT